MDVTQIYATVNSVCQQAFGETAITAVDDRGLIALGNTVLSSSNNTELFMNTLAQRIGMTIISFRRYTSKYSKFIRDDFEWGAAVQKIKVKMPDAEEDQSFGLEDGGSVDMYKIAKPKATQKLFLTETPTQFHVTIQRKQLQEAFLSAAAMGSFISAIFGEVQNKIEIVFERLGKQALNNLALEIKKDTSHADRVVKLVTLFNAEQAEGNEVTATTALQNKDFLTFAAQQIRLYSDYFEEMSVLYNDGSETRHTPKDYQSLFCAAKFSEALSTIAMSQAFNKEELSIGTYEKVTYWQAAKDRLKVQGIPASNDSGTNTQQTITNLIAIMCDYEAFGLHKSDDWSSTTPFNSAGGYANTYWHFKKQYFNDLSENAVIFTLD